MAKTSGGNRNYSSSIKSYGRQGYALFDGSGKQVTKALFGFKGVSKVEYASGKEEAKAYLKFYRDNGIGKGKKYYIKKAQKL